MANGTTRSNRAEPGIDAVISSQALTVQRNSLTITDDTVQVLVHQDLHGDNVLAAEREPWLVIDPKPFGCKARIFSSLDYPKFRVRALNAAGCLPSRRPVGSWRRTDED